MTILTISPTSIDFQPHDNNADKKKGEKVVFIKFYSEPIDVFIAMDEKEIEETIKVCNDALKEIRR